MLKGSDVRRIRKRLALSQTELAKRAGVSRTVINQFESGKLSSVHLRTLVKIQEALGIFEAGIGDDDDALTRTSSADEALFVVAHKLESLARILRDATIAEETRRGELDDFAIGYLRSTGWNLPDNKEGLVEKRFRKG